MSGLSTAALLALVLAIALNTFPLANSVDPPQTHTAAPNQGSPSATQANDCTFPTGDVFATGDPVPAGRSLDTNPDSIVLLDAVEYAYMEAETLQIADGQMENPADPFHVGWYEQTATPSEPGNVVMAGYVDYWNVGPTPLANLTAMTEGAEIQVNTPGGTSYVYAVEWARNYELPAIGEADSAEVLGPTAEPSLTIITCSGEFDYEAGAYPGRTVVRATLQTSFDTTEGEASPAASPVATPGSVLVNAEPRPFAREDCDVEPRTREELIEILGTLPAPVGPGSLTDEQLPLDQQTFDQLQDTVHDYQACRLFGMTLEWTALLSEDELRQMVYENGQTTPYSPAVLDEIVRGWEEIDAPATERAESLSDDDLANWCAVVLAPDLPSEGSLFVSDAWIQVPAVLAAGDQVVNTGPFEYNVAFVLEDGRWQIDQLPENVTNCA